MLGLRSAYEMVPLIILLEAVVVLYIYSRDSQIVLKNPLTLTSSKTTLSLFSSELFFAGGSGGYDNCRRLAVMF